MNRLTKFYNQNRYIIWLVILIVVAIITLIQILDEFASKKIAKEDDISKNTIITTDINKNYSVITGEEIKNNASQIIETFLDYCNNGKIDLAYEILSDDCKEVLYPTIKDFQEKYYNKIFINKKSYVLQAWINTQNTYTYKVDFVDDMLATGKPSNKSICDYYTVIKNNDIYELNINKFIEIKNINKSQEKDNIIINIKRKRIYTEHEIYEIEIKNQASGEIKLDDLTKNTTIYLEDGKQEKYYWNSSEFIDEDMLVVEGQTKVIQINFNKWYQPQNQSRKIVFSNIIKKQEKTIIDISLTD